MFLDIPRFTFMNQDVYKKEILEHWEYYASKTPFWREIIEQYNGLIDNENKSQNFFLSLNDSISIKCENKKFKLSEGDVIFNINGNSFNKNGKIYCEKLKLYLSINTYLMINGSDLIDINFFMWGVLLF